ncbi:MAG: response regulator [Verrucomicrobiota bacterium]
MKTTVKRDKMRILAVDDQASNTRLVKLCLEQTNDYVVREENDAKAALATAEEFLPHLILLDVLMPGMDGWDLAACFQANPKLKGVPIVFLTASITKSEVDAGGGRFGLVVTKRLVELMEGVLGVESTVGVGSVFWCELISAAAPQLGIQSGEVVASARPQLPDGAPRRTLLYVEDNPANMKLVEQLIARCPDIELLTAVNGTLGIEIARANQPQVILMDINPPGISGVEALRILREDPATAHIPVIALSANAMPRDIAMGLESGFFRYLTKPIKVKEFMDTLDEALELAERTVDQAGGQVAVG